MVLGSFQCWGVLLLLHVVGQGPAVLAAGAGRVDYIFHLPFLMSWLLGDGWTWLKYCGFGCWTPTVDVSYCRGYPRLVLVNRLEGLSLPRNSATINWPALHDLVVDWGVKLQHKHKLTGNKDSDKILEKFDFHLDRTIHFGVTCPWVPKNTIFDLVRGIAFLILIRSLWDLQIIWTGIKSQTSSNSCQMELLTLELLAL